ncbi:MAG: hypothetical protein IJZ35_04195 [Clostridia bacterium]|nr:hypothetical protein [Clostridia bacterium]
MKLKKLLVLFLAFSIVFAFTACQDNDNPDVTDETTTSAEIVTDDMSVSADETTTASSAENAETTTLIQTSETTTAETTTIHKDDPSQWSKSKIVDVYKQAAAKSSAVKSKQSMSLADVSINDGEGAINGMFKLIKPIITGILSSNSTEFDGITGGHQNLVYTDIASAKAYASGENTVIEMTMVEQTDGAHGDMYSGTVGHAISVVGDISTVLDMLEDAGLSATVPDEGISMTYTDPTLKVLIDSDGKIVNGTWSYNVDLKLSDYSVGSVTVDKTSVVIDYIITVNGGFSE